MSNKRFLVIKPIRTKSTKVREKNLRGLLLTNLKLKNELKWGIRGPNGVRSGPGREVFSGPLRIVTKVSNFWKCSQSVIVEGVLRNPSGEVPLTFSLPYVKVTLIFPGFNNGPIHPNRWGRLKGQRKRGKEKGEKEKLKRRTPRGKYEDVI